MLPVEELISEFEALLRCDANALDTAGVALQTQRTRRLRGVLDRVDAELATRATALYEAGNSAPATDVITRNQHVSAAEARRREKRAEALARSKQFGDALAAGSIGAEHADVLANVSSKLSEEARAEFFSREDTLLASATTSTPEQFAKTARNLADRIARDQGLSRNERQRRNTAASRRIDDDGMYTLTAKWHPELGAAVWSSLDAKVAAMAASPENAGVDRNQLLAYAVAEYLVGAHQPTRPIEAEVILVADVTTATTGELHEHSICETNHGVALPPESVRRLLCNGRITPIIVDSNGVVLSAGRTSRLANRAQRRALRSMYGCCAFEGCDVPFSRCEVHHVVPWELGGPTDLENLLPLCSRHHHLVHELGWRLDLAPDRTLTIRQPNGTIVAETRPRPPGRPRVEPRIEPRIERPPDPIAERERHRPSEQLALLPRSA
jgi:hypothetical protein